MRNFKNLMRNKFFLFSLIFLLLLFFFIEPVVIYFVILLFLTLLSYNIINTVVLNKTKLCAEQHKNCAKFILILSFIITLFFLINFLSLSLDYYNDISKTTYKPDIMSKVQPKNIDEFIYVLRMLEATAFPNPYDPAYHDLIRNFTSSINSLILGCSFLAGFYLVNLLYFLVISKALYEQVLTYRDFFPKVQSLVFGKILISPILLSQIDFDNVWYLYMQYIQDFNKQSMVTALAAVLNTPKTQIVSHLQGSLGYPYFGLIFINFIIILIYNFSFRLFYNYTYKLELKDLQFVKKLTVGYFIISMIFFSFGNIFLVYSIFDSSLYKPIYSLHYNIVLFILSLFNVDPDMTLNSFINIYCWVWSLIFAFYFFTHAAYSKSITFNLTDFTTYYDFPYKRWSLYYHKTFKALAREYKDFYFQFQFIEILLDDEYLKKLVRENPEETNLLQLINISRALLKQNFQEYESLHGPFTFPNNEEIKIRELKDLDLNS